MGEYAWKLHLEKKQEEAFEMDAIEKKLNAIYSGMDPKMVGLLTTSKASTMHLEGGEPQAGRLLAYQEAKRLTAHGEQVERQPQVIAQNQNVQSTEVLDEEAHVLATNMESLD